MRQQHHGAQGADSLAEVGAKFRELRQLCRNLVTLTPFRRVPIGAPEAEPQGNAMCVRITVAGAVAFALLTYLTAPVSACDERYIKKCEKAAAAAAGAAEEPSAPAAKRKASGRVQVVMSRRAKHMRLAKRARAPAFATRGGMTLTSAESRMTTVNPESAIARRFRGFIDPTPIAQNAFEALRKPHLVALNLELPVALAQDIAPVVAEAPAQPAAPAPVAAAKQDRITPQAAAPQLAAPQPAVPQPTMELASAESKRVTLPDPAPAKPALVAAANATPAPESFFSAAAPQPDQPPSSGFPVHQLVIALCGALGVAGALRFVVGA
jgi:hypothetical protein